MRCVICRHDDVDAGTTTVILDRGGCTLAFREVPVSICGNCGEYYLDEAVAEVLLSRAEEVVRGGAEVVVQRYAA